MSENALKIPFGQNYFEKATDQYWSHIIIRNENDERIKTVNFNKFD